MRPKGRTYVAKGGLHGASGKALFVSSAKFISANSSRESGEHTDSFCCCEFFKEEILDAALSTELHPLRKPPNLLLKGPLGDSILVVEASVNEFIQ